MRGNKYKFRISAVMTAAVMAAVISACTGQQDKTLSEKKAGDAAETTAAEQTTAPEPESESKEAADTEALIGAADAATEIYITDFQSVISRDNTDTKLKLNVSEREAEEAKDSGIQDFETKVQFLTVEDEGFCELQKELDRDNEESLALVGQTFTETAEFLKELNESGEEPTVPYAIEDTIFRKRADDLVLSYVRENYSQLGGAHPSTYFTGKNFDVMTGEELTLKDAASDYDGIYKYVMDELAKREQEDGNENCYFKGYEDTVKLMFYGAEDAVSTDAEETGEESGLYQDMAVRLQWYLEDDGVTVIFNSYDIAPYAYGPSIIKIPFDTGLLKAEYKG